MSRSTRLTLLCHAPIQAPQAAAFPIPDMPLLDGGAEKVRAIGILLPRLHGCLSGPERRARQTAEAITQHVVNDPELGDLDMGRWSGQRLADLETREGADLLAWMGSPDAAPHGGESVSAVVRRISAWLARHLDAGGHRLAVTHPAVLRAAVVSVLDAPAASFWNIDIEPLTIVELSADGRRWTLRSLVRPGDRHPA